MTNVLIKPGIVVDGKEYAVLPSGGCMTISLANGLHTVGLKLSDRYQGDASKTIQIEMDSPAYVKLTTRIEKIDYVTSRRVFSFDQTDQLAFNESIKTCKPIDPTNGKMFKKSSFISDN